MFEWVADPAIWASFFTLALLEIVLGIDNVIFISILAQRLPPEERAKARAIGLSLALGLRILLLLFISVIIAMTFELFRLFDHPFSLRDLILIAGGLFLIYKGTSEIHNVIEGEDHGEGNGATATFGAILTQIIILDIVFSLDSVITAVGMVEHVPVMIAAMVVAVGVMFFAAGPVSRFIEKHPSIKMLALSFLLMIGLVLVADGLGAHVPKGYVYSAVGFSIFVEMLNLARRRKRAPTMRAPIETHFPRPPTE